MTQTKVWAPAAFLFIVIYSFLGFDWGIVNPHRVSALHLEEPSNLLEDIAQLTKEKGYQVNLHVTGHEEGELDVLYLQSIQHLTWDKNKTDFLRLYRHYLAWSYSGDLSTAFGPLSTMHPRQFDFNPHSFQYGGAFLYPLALVLKASSGIGYTHVVSDATYYVLHPLELGKLAMVGRALCVLMHVATILLIYKTAALWKDRLTGFLAATLYEFIPGAISLSREIKPHAYAVAWVMLSLYYALRYSRENRDRYWLLSSVGAGLAAGSCLNYGVSFLIPIFALAGAPAAKRMRNMCLSVLLFGAVLFGSNPYILISHDLFFQEMTVLKHAFYVPGEVQTPWSNIFLRGAPWWFSVAGVMSLIFYSFGRDSRSEKLILAAFPVLYTLSFYAASHGECPPRFAIVIYPFLSMMAAWGLSRIIHEHKGVGTALAAALILLTALKGTAYVVNFVQDSAGQSNVFRAGRFISQLPAGSSIGGLSLPTPGTFPPLPFHRYRLTTFPDIDKLNQASAPELPDYFVITDDAIADIPRYRLVADYVPFSFGTRKVFRPDILSPGTPAWRFRIFQKT